MLKKVCIFGSYKDLSSKEKAEIFRLGEILARNGITVISGGFGGTMEDISRGAKSAGGKTIGVTCYIWDKALYKKANDFVDEEITAKDLFERIGIMLKESDAFVVFPGGTGTLLELSAVLEHMNKGLSEYKPVILPGDFWKPAVSCLKKEPVLNEDIRKARSISYCDELVTFVESIEECISKLGL